MAALLERFRVSSRDLAALRKSAVLRLWLKLSWDAWLWGIGYSIFARWIFPALTRPVLRWIWPPNKGHGLTRITTFLNNSMVEDPHVDRVLAALAPIVWLIGFSLFLALLELKIRPAIQAAKSRSRTLEHEADTRLSRAPTESVMLLRQAIDFAVDPVREADLREKLSGLDARLSRGGAAADAPAGASAAARPRPPAPSGGASGSGPRKPAPSGEWKPAEIQVPVIEPTIMPDGGASKRVGPRGRYRLDEEIARGGMGVVWKGFDTVLERVLAVKQLPKTTDPSLRDRFRQEALALARLSHPNIVQIYDFIDDENDEAAYIVMELVEGGDLDSILQKQKGKMPMSRALDLGRQIALGLAAAHKRGIVHRDVKPLNVLVTGDGIAKVTDFGLAKVAEASMHTVEGTVLGSPRYMSPEQAAGKPADARSDVYSFGATLFHLIAGRPPFEGDTASVLAQHITQPPPQVSSINPGVPRALDKLILDLLAKEPDARPKGLDQVAQTLFEQFQSGARA